MAVELGMGGRKERLPGVPKLYMHLKKAAQTRDWNEGERFPSPGSIECGLCKQPPTDPGSQFTLKEVSHSCTH